MEFRNSLALGIDKRTLILPNHGLNLKNDQLISVFGKYPLGSLMSSASLPQLAARPAEPPRPRPRPAGPAPPGWPLLLVHQPDLQYVIQNIVWQCDMVHVTSTEIGENIKCSLILIKLWSFWNVYEQQTALSEILAECRYCRYIYFSMFCVRRRRRRGTRTLSSRWWRTSLSHV